MLSSQYLLTILVGAVLQSLPALAHVRKEGRVCTVMPKGYGRDDSQSIISAFARCNEDASVVFLNETYHVERVMSTHGLRNVTVDVRGTLVVRWSLSNAIPRGCSGA